MDINSAIRDISVFAIPAIFAITLHEAAHAYAAKRCGDATAYMLGRMTLNPLKHIDPVGTILVPLLTKLFAGFLIGWAKPVPVNFAALRNPRTDMIWVALAGPAANLLMMIGWAVLLKIVAGMSLSVPVEFIARVAEAGIFVNVILMVFNLLPILPLDGGRVVAGLLPPKLSYTWSRSEPYGMFVILGLAATGVLWSVVGPLVGGTLKAVYSTFGFLP